VPLLPQPAEADGAGLLALSPDASAPFFFASAIGIRFEDAWQPFLGGLFRYPVPVFYKASFQAAELALAVMSHSDLGERHLSERPPTTDSRRTCPV
jgi:hypothetical protein